MTRMQTYIHVYMHTFSQAHRDLFKFPTTSFTALSVWRSRLSSDSLAGKIPQLLMFISVSFWTGKCDQFSLGGLTYAGSVRL